MKKIIYIFPLLLTTVSNAFEFKGDSYSVDFDTLLMGGVMGYKTEGIDSDARGLYSAQFELAGKYKFENFILGANISELLVSNKEYSSKNQYGLIDAFVYFQNQYGRIELGRADSIACKLHVFVPEVSGLRMHQESFIYKYLLFGENSVTTTAANSLDSMNRITFATSGKNNVQFGFGYTPGGKINDTQEREVGNSFDLGVKFKNIENKLKTTASLGISYIDNPIGEFEDGYLGDIKSDYRMEFSSGVNISYNSFTFGVSGKYVYDKGNELGTDEKYIVGSGLSYDLLNWSTSFSYYYSNVEKDRVNTLVYSNKYKFNEMFDVWLSVGAVLGNENSGFIASGIGVKF